MAARFGVPVYLYEEAAANPARRNLEDIRRGEFEGLAAKMASPGWAPGFRAGAPHASAGASVIGARMPLIAYNINLATDRLDVAKKIAAAIRHSTGGFRFVKAAGFELEDRGIVQVSMNLTNYEKTPIFRVFETVKREAERYGVTILESEIVGLVPSAALNAAAEYYLQIAGFNAGQVLENKLTADSNMRKSEIGKPEEHSLRDSRSPELPNRRLIRPLLPRGAPARCRGLHLSIEVAALDAEHFGRARDVAVLRGQRAQDVVALQGSRASSSVSDRGRRRLGGRARRRRRGTPGPRARSCRPGTMIISRSITFRSSRTLPGQR